MALESGTYISDLVATNPEAGDDVSTTDDHLQLVKSTILATFPNIAGAVTPTHTELNYVDGVTSAIQTQLDAKAALASPALTGTPTAPTASAATNTTQIATTAFVQTAVGGLASTGAWALIKSVAASSSATVDFVNGSASVVIDGTYDEYMLVLIKIRPATDGASLYFRTSTNAGSSYDASASDYRYAVNGGASATAAQYPLSGSTDNTSGYGISGTVLFYKPSDTTYFHIISDCLYTSSVSPGEAGSQRNYGWREAAANVDAVRFLFSGGNIASGTFNLYGRRK